MSRLSDLWLLARDRQLTGSPMHGDPKSGSSSGSLFEDHTEPVHCCLESSVRSILKQCSFRQPSSHACADPTETISTSSDLLLEILVERKVRQ